MQPRYDTLEFSCMVSFEKLASHSGWRLYGMVWYGMVWYGMVWWVRGVRVSGLGHQIVRLPDTIRCPGGDTRTYISTALGALVLCLVKPSANPRRSDNFEDKNVTI